VTPLRPKLNGHGRSPSLKSPAVKSPSLRSPQREAKFAAATVYLRPSTLEDPPSPAGRLSDRIDNLRLRCIEGLGVSAFKQAYQVLKALQKDEEELECEVGGESYGETESTSDCDDSSFDDETTVAAKLEAILGKGNLHYSSLIDQVLLFALFFF